MTLDLAIVVVPPLYGLVTNIAELSLAPLASQHISFPHFLINLLAPGLGAHRTEAQIDPLGILLRFLDDLLGYFAGQHGAGVALVVWILLVVLLSLGNGATLPAQPRVAFGALDLRAPGLYLADGHPAFRIGARFRAVFYEQFVQDFL